jgi:hypothetical protein
MQAEAECYLCLLSQVFRVAGVLQLDNEQTMKMVRDACHFLARTSFNRTPPEISEDLYKQLAKLSGNPDPYSKLKRESIEKAWQLYPELKEMADSSADPLRTALEISLAGNVIDFGASASEDWLKDKKFLNLGSLAIDDYKLLVEDLDQAKKVVFIGDNAGETVFDRLFIERLSCPVVYAVREEPIINDATIEEARLSGLAEVAELVSSGCQAPGTVLENCSPGFIKILKKAELIIAKGQGNFECLEQIRGPFYFLLKAKCEVVARYLEVSQGELIIMRSKNFNRRLSFQF